MSDGSRPKSTLGALLAGIVNPALRHDADCHEAGHSVVQTVYELASDGDGRRAARGRSDIVSQFLNFQRLQEPFQRAFEQVAGSAAKVPSLEQQLAELRSAVAERDGLLEAGKLRAEAAELRVAELAAEAEAQRTRLEEIIQERDQHMAALQEACSSLGERDTALQQASNSAEQSATLLQAAETERTALLAELEARLARLTTLAEERDALRAANTTLSSRLDALQDAAARSGPRQREQERADPILQSELASLRAVLSETDRSRHRAEAATAELQAELAALQSAHARNEGRIREGEAAGARLAAEARSLKDELAAAREVGRAALDALRCGPAPSPPPLSTPGWGASMLRRLGLRNQGARARRLRA